MDKKYKIYLAVLLSSIVILFLVVATAIGIFLKPPSPSRAFRKLVCRPIPKSVRNIKMDWHVGLFGTHTYVLHFAIDKSDLPLILNSRTFKEVPDIEYTGSGQLWWEYLGTGSRQGLSLYKPTGASPAPKWFNLQQWDSPKVYVFHEERVIRTRFLVYNEELSEVYFIDVGGPD